MFQFVFQKKITTLIQLKILYLFFSTQRCSTKLYLNFMKTSDLKSCTLHAVSFEYFCQRCLEPVCRQCTIIGPHNTQLHSISSISTAYERRLLQIRARITNFLQNKEGLIEQIKSYGQEVEQLKQTQQLGLAQNERHRTRILTDLQRSYERISGQITLIKEQLENRLNNLNDLGHQFENITDNVQILGSHSSILQALKESYDRLVLLLQKEENFGELPKQLTSLRVDLKSIEVYQGLISQKKTILFEISQRLKNQIQTIQTPSIDYQTLLQQLSSNIDRCIQHNVCHYCGVIFSLEATNTTCKNNNAALDINQFKGFCSSKPDSSKWATHRHYFAAPAQPLLLFKSKEESTFSLHLRALLLKLKTICVIKKIDLIKCFQAADRKNSGTCDKISMIYTLIEVCGLNQAESQILLTICDQASKMSFNYSPLLQRLEEIKI